MRTTSTTMTAKKKNARVTSFCEETALESFFTSFPQGYATLLGEEGVNISGGQKQLVALARALYQKPQLLLLDESTSAMDRETEQKVWAILNRLGDQMAIVLVTHRVQSMKHTDRIYILEDGRITKSGTPDVLLNRDNLFSRSARDVYELF